MSARAGDARSRWRRIGTLAAIFPWLLLTAGCEVAQVAAGRFPSTEPLSSELVRGASTRADVERILGTPSGTGGSCLPPDRKVRDVWFYQTIKVNGMHHSQTGGVFAGELVLDADVTQQILLVFFADERYDGYMWFANAGKAEAKAYQGIP